MLEIEKFTVIPESVEAVYVTHENMAEVAEWAGVELLEMSPGRFQIPMNDEDDYAIVGEWVVKSPWEGFVSYEDIDGGLNPKRFIKSTE